MSDRQIETMFAALEARTNAMQAQLDNIDTRTAAMVENINLLRGDAQRVQAAASVDVRLPNPPAPVTRGRRPTPEQLAQERADEHPAPAFAEAR